MDSNLIRLTRLKSHMLQLLSLDTQYLHPLIIVRATQHLKELLTNRKQIKDLYAFNRSLIRGWLDEMMKTSGSK